MVRVLGGLPPYGEPVTPVPEAWGRLGREGLVVEFGTDAGNTWVANFRPGLGGLDVVRVHPDGHTVIVIAAGATWLVDPLQRTAVEIADAIDAMWSVTEPEGVVLSRQGLGFFRLWQGGTLWHTRRISWDGFKDVELSCCQLRGFAWAPFDPEWTPFTVDLNTGSVQGGSYRGPDSMHWERLANG